QLENAVLRATSRVRGLTSPSEKTLRDFGSGLFESVFMQSEIRSKYEGSLLKVGEQAKQSGAPAGQVGLRIRLQIEPPELSTLPWEFLYDKRKAQYLNLDRGSPVLRYLEMNQEDIDLTVDGPLRVLGMIANPGPPKWAPLDTEKERRVIDEAVTPL